MTTTICVATTLVQFQDLMSKHVHTYSNIWVHADMAPGACHGDVPSAEHTSASETRLPLRILLCRWNSEASGSILRGSTANFKELRSLHVFNLYGNFTLTPARKQAKRVQLYSDSVALFEVAAEHF